MLQRTATATLQPTWSSLLLLLLLLLKVGSE
jgi:hypothetical protein